MMGECGSDTCDLGSEGPCGGFSDCEPCLNSRLECAWIADRCEPSCDAILEDVPCYHPSNFPGLIGPEICAISNNSNNSQPMEDSGHPCNGFEICEPCLNSRIECAWIANRCERSCDVIMDVACYHPSNFPNMTGPEICAIADTAQPVIMGPPDALMNETWTEETEEDLDTIEDETIEDTEGGEEDSSEDEANGGVGALESTSGTMSRVISMAGVAVVSVAAIAFL
jgi:hypothetical protein